MPSNIVSDDGIHKASELYKEMTLGEIHSSRGTPDEILKGVNSVFSAVRENLDAVEKIIN